MYINIALYFKYSADLEELHELVVLHWNIGHYHERWTRDNRKRVKTSKTELVVNQNPLNNKKSGY